MNSWIRWLTALQLVPLRDIPCRSILESHQQHPNTVATTILSP